MSAQSSARSKRRQSALFSSKSLLPLPQISISSIATSTPARGNQRQLPAPLPTPGPSEAHLLGTPARIQDGNATFFGFSPGVEANETALLAVDYRSIRREDDARDEQSHEDIFDDTAILEQRAFANRRCSNEGDQSLGGLGALIFSNLIAGNQAQEALERLELGRRRDGNTSRQSITLSPVRRNASFTLSTAGEYLVDYETDVRFGDDLQDVYDQAADASLDNKRISSNVPPASFDFRSSPIKSLYPSSSPHVVNKSILHMTTSRQENLVEHHLDDQQSTLYPAESTLGHSRAFSEAFQETSRPAIMEEMEVPGKDVFTVDQPTHGPLSPGSSRRTVEQSSAISPASVRSAISVPAEPSPTMAEKRLARRMRRGLTASMAVLLSPVAEDRDKEKSMSRSRSMLCEAVEDQCSHRSHVEAETGHPSVQNHSDRTLHPPTEQDTQTHTEDAPANVQEFSIQQTESENGCNAEKHVPPPVSTEMAELIPLASLLTASVPNVDYSANLSAHGSSRVYAPPSDSLAVPSEAVSAVIHHPPKLALKRQSVKAASNPTPAVNLLKRQHTLTQKEGPSYLKPTLSRSIQQRDTVPLRRSVSLSSTQIVGNAASLRRTASHSVVRQAPKPSQTTEIGREPLELSVDKKCVASTSGSVAASQSTAPVSKKHSVDDFFERRQRDGGKVSIAMQGKGEGKESDRIVHEPQEPRGPEAGKTAVSSDVMQASRSTTDDALTIPRGFAFAHTRRARNTASKEAQTASQKAPLRVKQSINQSAALREHSKSMHKARRVRLTINLRQDGVCADVYFARSFLQKMSDLMAATQR